MSARAAIRAPGAASATRSHIHLPSIHVRDEYGGGFDYEEDIYLHGRGMRRRAERVIHFAVIEQGRETMARVTMDELCFEDLADLDDSLPVLMDEGNPDAQAVMEERGRHEFARQVRIAAGQEQACARCGCSESRACSGGCIWATTNLCSRCVRSNGGAA